jgi:hypothetical protein
LIAVNGVRRSRFNGSQIQQRTFYLFDAASPV